MVSGLNIVQDYDEYYEEAYYAWSPYYPLAERDMRFYLGDQWDEKEKQLLFSEGRSEFVFNKVRRNINLITGYQRKNRLSSVVVPVENSDQYTADLRSQLLLYILQSQNGYETISDCFGGAIKTGMNLATLWMDYREDPINGDIRIGREPFNGFITDPYFTKLDWSDCNYVIRRKYLSADQAASILPGYEKEIKELHKMGWSRDDKFTWLPYQRQPNGQDLIAFNEFYQQKWKKVPMLVDMETGEYTEWKGKEEGLKEFVSLYPQLKIVEMPQRYIENHIILNDQYIETITNPFGLNEYPFVPFVALWEPESDLWGLKLQSLIRCQIDPQRESNRRISQMVDLLDSQINSGWIADDDSVINPRSLFQSSQGKVIWRKRDAKPGAIEKIPPSQIPPSMFELQKLYDTAMMEILGVNDAAFGIAESGNESGVMMMMRQGAAIVNLQDVFDKLRFSQRMLSQKVLKMAQDWSASKIMKITNMEPSEKYYDVESNKYDVAVQEGILTDTQRQVHFRQLVELKEMGVPVTGEMLAEAAPLQGKTEFIKQLSQLEQQQQQAAQQKAEVEQALVKSQTDMAQAKSISDVALAKERFTRAIANLGLEDERASKAIDDRASAALDRVKAIKELDSMDDDKIMKYLKLISLMEEQARLKEEEIKKQDVAITAQGGQQTPEQNPVLSDAVLREQTSQQPAEVFNG